MKKIFSWIVLIVAAIAFVGCTKNEDSKENAILGTWRLYREVYENPDGSIMWEDDDWDYYVMRYTFKEDGKLEVFDDGDYANGSYSISGDQLILNDGYYTTTCTIRTLTATELVIVEKDSSGGSDIYYLKRVN